MEDYSVLVATGLACEASLAGLAEDPLVWAAVLGEQRALSPDAAGAVTGYYPDDLVLLSWNGALLNRIRIQRRARRPST